LKTKALTTTPLNSNGPWDKNMSCNANKQEIMPSTPLEEVCAELRMENLFLLVQTIDSSSFKITLPLEKQIK
jgi:hypothetical protein